MSNSSDPIKCRWNVDAFKSDVVFASKILPITLEYGMARIPIFEVQVPLTSTIWVRSTIKPFTVHSRSSVLLLNICNIDFSLKNLGMPRTEPRAAGREARSSVPSKCVGRMRQGF